MPPVFFRCAALALVLTTAACQRPTAHTPQLDPAAIEAERAAHEGIIAGRNGERRNVEFSEADKRAMLATLDRVAKRIARSGGEVCAVIRPPDSQCNFEFVLEQDPELNAYADGNSVRITPPMMAIMESDEQLALVLSHEMAHNIMGHVGSKTINALTGTVLGLAVDVLAASQGLDTGGNFTQLGADVGSISYSVSFEQEADYVGLYILARSGYDPARAAQFWRRLTLADPKGAYGGVTHPSNPERTVALQATLNEIAYKRSHGLPLLPDFRQ
jgi:beta-barrel assembly-enhancing protease